MRVALKLLGLAFAVAILSMFVFILLLFIPVKRTELNYVDLLTRISGRELPCTDALDGLVGRITLTFNRADSSLKALVGSRTVVLAYRGSNAMSDYFDGPNGEKIEIDPEIKHSGVFTEGGYCWE